VGHVVSSPVADQMAAGARMSGRLKAAERGAKTKLDQVIASIVGRLPKIPGVPCGTGRLVKTSCWGTLGGAQYRTRFKRDNSGSDLHPLWRHHMERRAKKF